MPMPYFISIIIYYIEVKDFGEFSVCLKYKKQRMNSSKYKNEMFISGSRKTKSLRCAFYNKYQSVGPFLYVEKALVGFRMISTSNRNTFFWSLIQKGSYASSYIRYMLTHTLYFLCDPQKYIPGYIW